MKRTILVFAVLILAILLLFQIGKYATITYNLRFEIVIAVIAVIFFFVGVYINKQSLQKSAVSVQEINLQKIKELEITEREYEVLQGISEGLSNKEIGLKLFVSESTIKTHVSNLLSKLSAKRRTHAIQIAKGFQIL